MCSIANVDHPTICAMWEIVVPEPVTAAASGSATNELTANTPRP